MLTRVLLRTWAKTGLAPAWLYAFLDSYGGTLARAPVIRVLTNGVRMRLDLSDHLQRQIYVFGAYEPHELSLFLGLLQPGDTVVDAGANVGFYSLMVAARVEQHGRVFSFEPVPDTYARLCENLALNRLPQVSPINCALWNTRETLTFALGSENRHNRGGYSVAPSERSIDTVRGTGIRLDDFLSEAGVDRVDAIKMDVEGAERFALDGGRHCLERDRPVVLLEVCRATCERAGYQTGRLWDIFSRLDYRAYLVGESFAASGWIDDFSNIEQRNVLLVRAEASGAIGVWHEKAHRRAFA